MSGYKVHVDALDDSRWMEMSAGFADATLFQTPAWVREFFPGNRLTSLALERGGEVRGLALGRVLKVPGLPVGVAHFLYGPLWRRRGAGEEVLEAMLRELNREYVLRRGLMLSLRPRETAEGEQRLLTRAGFVAEPEPFYRTIVIDLTPPADDLRRRLHPKWRRNLSRAERRGVEMDAGSTDAHWDAFISLHEQMMRRKNPQQWYNPDLERHRRVLETLPGGTVILLARHEGEPVAGNVVCGLGDTGMSLFGATGDLSLSRKLNALYFVHWQTVLHLREAGFARYDLRGYDPERFADVSHFKEGLGGNHEAYTAWRRCLNPASSLLIKAGETLAEHSDLRRLTRLRPADTLRRLVGGNA